MNSPKADESSKASRPEVLCTEILTTSTPLHACSDKVRVDATAVEKNANTEFVAFAEPPITVPSAPPTSSESFATAVTPRPMPDSGPAPFMMNMMAAKPAKLEPFVNQLHQRQLPVRRYVRGA